MLFVMHLVRIISLISLIFISLTLLPQVAHARFDVGIQIEKYKDEFVNESEANRIRTGRVDIVRTTFDWTAFQPLNTPGIYNFIHTDQLMYRLSKVGTPKTQVIPVLGGSPYWISPTQGEPPTSASDLNAWKGFLQALVGRYGPKGTFWSTPGVVYNPIRTWQVWNEPNLRIFWTNNKPNPKEYAKFLAFTDNILKQADPKSKTMLAGMPQREDTSKPMTEFLSKLYKVRGFKGHYDIVGIHPYGKDEKSIDNSITAVKELMEANLDDKEISISEFGFASMGPSTPYRKSQAGQAKMLSKIFELIKDRAREDNITSAIWFKWRDSAPYPPPAPHLNTWQTYTGLFKNNGLAKPAWKAFNKISGGIPGSGPVL